MNFYEILKTKKLGRGSPDYWTQLFAEHVGGKGEWKVTELTGALPITFRSNGTALIDYRIYGTEEGVGEQTENLFDINNVLENYYLNNGILTWYNTGGYALSDYIPIASNTVTISAKITKKSYYGAHWAAYDENETFIRGGIAFDAAGVGNRKKVVNTFGAAFIRVDYAMEYLTDCMLNLGSTALPYEPYGYKLPLTVTNGTETKTIDIYIGDSKLSEAEYIDYGEQKIYKRILFMTHNDKHFITKDNKDFCLRRRGYSG